MLVALVSETSPGIGRWRWRRGVLPLRNQIRPGRARGCGRVKGLEFGAVGTAPRLLVVTWEEVWLLDFSVGGSDSGALAAALLFPAYPKSFNIRRRYPRWVFAVDDPADGAG